MKREMFIRGFAGTLVLTGLALGYFTGAAGWYIVPAFVGFNLLQSSFTKFCPLEMMLEKAGMEGCTDGKAKAAAD
ncbi:MAG: DUF2892 domain-containing protein [bacterium]|jgi:hypothetical protein